MSSATIPLITYIMITTFTPGPNNVTAASAGTRLGLKRSLPYLLGMVIGFFAVMLLSGYFNFFLQAKYSFLVIYLKWVGFIYMLWLALTLFIHANNGKSRIYGYSLTSGILLQLVNPKVIIYGITLFGMFSNLLLSNSWSILFSSIVLALVGFVAVLTWCLLGSTLTRFLDNKRNALVFNLVLTSLLLYAALSIILE